MSERKTYEKKFWSKNFFGYIPAYLNGGVCACTGTAFYNVDKLIVLFLWSVTWLASGKYSLPLGASFGSRQVRVALKLSHTLLFVHRGHNRHTNEDSELQSTAAGKSFLLFGQCMIRRVPPFPPLWTSCLVLLSWSAQIHPDYRVPSVIFVRVPRFSSVSIIPRRLHTHISSSGEEQ
jgi:hypothetical protein